MTPHPPPRPRGACRVLLLDVTNLDCDLERCFFFSFFFLRFFLRSEVSEPEELEELEPKHNLIFNSPAQTALWNRSTLSQQVIVLISARVPAQSPTICSLFFF